ncbi:aromatic amino acid ammonia-lyase [Paractinoplanes ferrugineus]|uniref:Histidine ammonia-lyase n=1 Tax=Paractinoplanes ferrugineus TaxID=113564 RepID=A0A919J407_9ACTN|nr:aromatic amino acid ammonia-lyase [Actinoplanes ferrugineus]GIE12553.1 histidine ammonia-lyase [Actinoplanes ferrugineus]
MDLAAPLHPDDLARAAQPIEVTLPAAHRARITESRAFLGKILGEDRAVYGSTTGFGALVGFKGRDDPRDQADNTLAHLGAGQGPDLDPALVRATVLVRARSLAQAASGVSPHVVDALIAMLATTFAPAVPRFGSVGASGDLIPLGAAAQALRGRGFAYVGGKRMPAAEALAEAGLDRLPLDGRDALALVNGTSLTTAALTLAARQVRKIAAAQQDLTCLLTDLLGVDPQFLDERLMRRYAHPGAITVAARMRAALAGPGEQSGATRPGAGEQSGATREQPGGKRPLQEPYSIRCSPQLFGAAEDALRYIDQVVAADLAGVSDNPLFFPDDDSVVHGGNFFGQPAAFAADLLTTVQAQLGNLAERQLDLLVDPHRNGGLPPMLAAGPGQQHGLQGVQLASTALIAEIRRDAMPAGMQSLPTNLHNQDVVPFGTQAALRALDQAELLRLICGSLALGLRQAAYVGARRPTGGRTGELLAELEQIDPVDPDRPLEQDVRRAAAICCDRY